MVVEDPVVFDLDSFAGKFRMSRDKTWGFVDRNRFEWPYGWNSNLIPRVRRKGLPMHWEEGLANLVEILIHYGVSERDFTKLRWFYSYEDFVLSPSKIYKALGIEHSVGRYDYKRVRGYLDKGVPLLASYTNDLGDETLRIIFVYYMDERKADSLFSTYRKVHYIKLPKK
jgi:hypothetical protein